MIEALGEQALLLVIDNVWRVEELAPLLKGGPNCVRLLTTRDPLLAPAGTHVVALDVMSEGEAVALLTADLPGAGALDAVGLARQLHCWPLVLRLIKGALRERLMHEALGLTAAWQSVCQDLTDFGMTAFDDPRDEAVRVSLDISRNQLTAEERECYNQLAIFPAAAIHWAALGRLWGMELGRTRQLCRKLQRLSLVGLSEGTRTIWLHDVFRGYLQNEQRDKLVVLQRRFLDSYGLGRWVELPADEPHLWDYLAYHLIEAGRTAELAALFTDDAWMQVRVARDGYIYDGYLADLSQAWQLVYRAVRQATDATTGAAHLAACIHYALIRTSINALAGNYHPALVVRAVELGLWTIDRAFSTAYRVPDPEARTKMITALLATKRGSAEHRSVAATRTLEAAFALWNDEHRAYALAALAPHLTDQ